MKKIILACFAVSVMLVSCKNSSNQAKNAEEKSAESGAAIDFPKSSYDFGKIKQGDKVTHEFAFTNTGTEPLIISNATATCGCTVPEYPKQPVAPGQSGVIKVVFNSEGKLGMQQKVVTITSNTPSRISEVYLTGEVQAPAGTASTQTETKTK